MNEMAVFCDRGAIAGDLASGTIAYVDAEWVRDSGPLPALVHGPAGSFGWSGRPPGQLKAGVDPDEAAALVLLAVAKRAAAAACHAAGDCIEVTGSGVIARVTAGLVATAERRAERPRAIIDTTGDTHVLIECTERLADGGTLVLAGEQTDRFSIDLYPDVHVRGLRIRGVESPASNGIAFDGQVVPELFLETLACVRAGELLPSGAGWYRVQF